MRVLDRISGARVYARTLARTPGPPERRGGLTNHVANIALDQRHSPIARHARGAGNRPCAAVPGPTGRPIARPGGGIDRLAHFTLACEGEGSSERMGPAASHA